MKISRKVLEKLKNRIDLQCNFEIGGILGGIDGVVSEVFIDIKKLNNTHCKYIPDVLLLNQVIASWEENEQYQFVGMFHTHFRDGKLSRQDKEYINEIFECMPTKIENLYFPIVVLPKLDIYIYQAIRQKKSILIKSDILEIVDK